MGPYETSFKFSRICGNLLANKKLEDLLEFEVFKKMYKLVDKMFRENINERLENVSGKLRKSVKDSKDFMHLSLNGRQLKWRTLFL